MHHRHILYVAHGDDCFIHETAYSILSLWRQDDGQDYEVVVVTDVPERLTALVGTHPRLRCLVLEPACRDAWRGPQRYIHRIKPLAIGWAAEQVGAGPEDLFLFVDSDTTFTRSPAGLFDTVAQGHVVLNEREGGLADSRHRTRSHGKLYRASVQHTFAVRGQHRALAADTGLWNSGVIGFRAEHLEVFDETVALIDQMYPVVPIHTIEQVALSVVLQDRGVPLQDSGEVIFHYHPFKEFRQDLAQFFERYRLQPVAERLSRWDEIDPTLRIQPKLAFKALPKWQQQLRKYLGRSWRPLAYPWQN